MKINFNKVFIGMFLSMLLFVEGLASAQISSALLREGDALPGDLLGTSISGIGNSAQNGVGGYSFTVTTDGSFSHVWGNATGGSGTVLLSEATYGNYEQTSFESFFGMSDAGAVFYSAISDHTSGDPTGLDGVWLDDFLLLNENEPINELISQWSTFNSRPGMTTNGIPYWVGGYADNPGDPTENRALFRTTGSNVILKGGDFIAGVNLTMIVGDAIDFDVRYSGLGTNYILPAPCETGSTVDDVVMVSNAVAMSAGGSFIREDTIIPASVGGNPGEKYDNFDFLGITETGSYMITGDTTEVAIADEIVMVDGMIVLREGDTIDGMTLNGSIEGGFFNEDGDWAVIWDVDTSSGNVEALILNGEIVLLEGETVDWNNDGVIDGSDQNAFVTNFTGISALTLSSRDANEKVNLCFTADCDINGSTLEGGFMTTVSLAPPAIEICPDTATVTAGVTSSGSSTDICDEDSAIWTLQSTTFVAAFSPAPIAITFEGNTNPVVGGTDVTLRLVGGPEFGNDAAFIQLRMFNFSTGAYVGVPFIAQPDSDNTVYESTNPVADFVGPNGELRAEITCAKTVAGPIRLRMDRVGWQIQ